MAVVTTDNIPPIIMYGIDCVTSVNDTVVNSMIIKGNAEYNVTTVIMKNSTNNKNLDNFFI